MINTIKFTSIFILIVLTLGYLYPTMYVIFNGSILLAGIISTTVGDMFYLVSDFLLNGIILNDI